VEIDGELENNQIDHWIFGDEIINPIPNMLTPHGHRRAIA
jgi:hypothetical protein